MIKRTYGQAKADLARFAGSSGMAVNDPRLMKVVNRAIEELMHEGDWPGVVDRYRFASYGGAITLPGDLDRITHVAIDTTPVEMRSDWYEFLQGGPGIQSEDTWVDAFIDRGESCTFRDVPSVGLKLRVTGSVDERVNGVRPKITIQGYGSDGKWLRSQSGSQWIDGVEIEINGDTSPKEIVTSYDVISVSAVIKPETRGPVGLYATDGTASSALAVYAPRETAPSYRRYLVPFVSNDTTRTVIARARKRFVPIVEDNDFMLITNTIALQSMIVAQHKHDSNEFDGYFKHRGRAIALLKKEAESYRGTSIRPAMTFAPGFGMSDVAHFQ